MATTAAPSTPIAAVRRSPLPPWASLGIIFGLVGAASILLWGPIGVSGTYPRFIGAILRVVDPAYAAANPYLVRMGSLMRPETFLLVGLLIGGIIGARLDKAKAPKVEMLYAGEHSEKARYRNAFIGGILIVFGARVAGGCTSGLIISGMTQLSIAGFIFAAGTFAAGIGTAKVLQAVHARGN
ncbi:MAG: YeeE/YedE thiosulfate transporter family protein [Gemmatimonadaceae bacterium]